jgi:tetratricopeptide (TPR) repeat protein
MNNQRSIVSEISKELRKGEVAFLVGAGISTGRQSWLPLWGDLVLSLLEVVAGEESRNQVKYVEPHMGLLFNEVILHLMVQVIGLDDTVEVIKACMDTNSYSAIHKFLAWSTEKFGNVVLTPNYDELIEKAAEATGWRHSKDLLLKLHGTLSDIKNARFTVDRIFAPLEKSLAQRAVNMLKGRIVVVAGYRGADEFDIIPLLFEASPREIIWLAHGEIDRSVRERLDDKRYRYFEKVDVDEIFKKVYEETKQGKADPELDAWRPRHPGNQKDWWKPKLERWGDDLWRRSENEVRFLWARILDYLRIYRVLDNGIQHKPAEEAYERFLRGSPDPVLDLEARTRLAYIRRTTGTGSLKEIYDVIASIKSTLDETRDRSKRERLQRLLGWALHEYGTALQNSGEHVRAKLVLEEATKLRALIGDLELAYSLFQQFMNATRAVVNVRGSHVDDFAPTGWRGWLIKELERYANRFKETSQPEHHGQTLHNIGFIHQFLAEEFEELKDFNKAKEEYNEALKAYREAQRIRERLRDPRMIAQSKVRIAQCDLGLAQLAYQSGNKERAKTLIEKAKQLASQVKGLYELIPQEPFRLRDVEGILERASRLEHDLLKSTVT